MFEIISIIVYRQVFVKNLTSMKTNNGRIREFEFKINFNSLCNLSNDGRLTDFYLWTPFSESRF